MSGTAPALRPSWSPDSTSGRRAGLPLAVRPHARRTAASHSVPGVETRQYQSGALAPRRRGDDHGSRHPRCSRPHRTQRSTRRSARPVPPAAWAGTGSPIRLRCCRGRPSVDHAMRLTIDRPGEQMIERILSGATRRRLRGKARKLESLQGFRYFRANTPAEIDRLLDAFLAAKAVHMAQQGLDERVRGTWRGGLRARGLPPWLPNGQHLIDIHALEGDGEMLAMFAVVADEHRCSSMFNTYTLSENSRHSPGLILLRQMVIDSADRGLRGFDLGVGKADYKSVFCNEVESAVRYRHGTSRRLDGSPRRQLMPRPQPSASSKTSRRCGKRFRPSGVCARADGCNCSGISEADAADFRRRPDRSPPRPVREHCHVGKACIVQRPLGGGRGLIVGIPRHQNDPLHNRLANRSSAAPPTTPASITT